MSQDAESLRREALKILAETRRDFPHYKRDLDRVLIRLSGRLTRSAGNADPRTGVVQLSEPIFSLKENAPGYRNTVLHEIAHVVAGPDVPAHGKVWRSVFIELGGDGSRTHNFRAARQHKTHAATCAKCRGEVELGTRRFHRLLAGARDYIHIGCGGAIVPVGEAAGREARATASLNKRPAKVPAHCSRCGESVRIGPIRFSRLVAGKRGYRHRRCGGEIVPQPKPREPGGGEETLGFEQRDLFD